MLQLVETYRTTRVLGHETGQQRKVYFPKLARGTPGYTPRWSLVMALEVPGVRRGDRLDVRGVVTVSCKEFVNPKTKKPGQLMLRAQVTVAAEVPPDDGIQRGEPASVESGENMTQVENLDPYYQPVRFGWWACPWDGSAHVCYYLFPASNHGKHPQYVEVYTTSAYNLLETAHYRPAGTPEEPSKD